MTAQIVLGRLAFSGFDWDGGNREKCRRHGLEEEAIERVFANAPRVYEDPVHSSEEARFQAVGWGPGDRPVFVAFTLRERQGLTLVRPISARYMHKRELLSYEEAAADLQQR